MNLLIFAGVVFAAVNHVEPLSNGLSLGMTGPQIRQQFGEPAHRSWDARSLSYPGFTVQVGGGRQEIWHLTLKKGVSLSCGIGVGSARDDVEKVFGASEAPVEGQYKLLFTYKGDRVSGIRIDPASGSFAASAEPASALPASFVGTWHGVGSTIGQLELKPDGTKYYFVFGRY